jgi:hypothetical protein
MNHSSIIIKLNTKIMPSCVITRGFSNSIASHSVQDYSGECSRKTGSSSALVFPGEVFVHSSVTEFILSVDTV